MRRADRALALLMALALPACVTRVPAPVELPLAQEMGTHAFGGWIHVDYPRSDSTPPVQGELIAASHDSIFVLTARRLEALPTAALASARLVGYDSRPAEVFGGAAIGSLAALSNGWFVIFMGPAWWLTGSLASRAQARLPERKVPPLSWEQLADFARFPQGMPPTLVRDTLRRQY